MKGTFTVISRDRLNGMLAADEDRFDWLGEDTDERGWLWSHWKDKKTGHGYAVLQAVTVHMGFNSSPKEKVDEFCKIVEEQGFCKASWGVTGRTKHMILAQELADMLPQYKFEIGYNYDCTAYRRDEE